uniref:Uncharacterized protein n=1 Tax=Rhizophora mucronata TaxID=61149 RepID=A0A2P2N7S3_RHIMU
MQYGKDFVAFEDVFLKFESFLCGADDYAFLVRKLGNRGDCAKATHWFEFAVRREKIRK